MQFPHLLKYINLQRWLLGLALISNLLSERNSPSTVFLSPNSMEFSFTTLTETDIDRIITGFENGTLPKAEWTHAAHFVMALHYALRVPENELLSHIRPRIRAYNDAVGTPNTTTSGYHETLTIFYIRVVTRFLKEQYEKSRNTLSPVALTNLLLQSEIADRTYPLRFYDKERLFSPEARANWVPPEREF